MDASVAARVVDLQAEEGGQLPFDLRTLLVSFWRRRLALVVGCSIVVVLAYLLSKPLANSTFEAETSLLYGARLGGVTESFYETPSLRTQLDLVKLPAHLARVREELGLTCELNTLGAAVDLSSSRQTSLVTVRVEWDEAQQAADITNHLRNAFLEAGVALRRAEAERMAADFEVRLAIVESELAAADIALGEFTRANNIVDLHEEAKWLLDQQSTIEMLIEKSRVEKRSTALQLEDIEAIMDSLNKQVASEKIEASQFDDVSVASTRSRRLQNMIDEVKRQGARNAYYLQKKSVFESLDAAYKKGAVPRLQYEEARGEYEAARALAVEGKQMQEWRAEIKKLDNVILPASGGLETASGPLLRKMMVKSFDLRLENTSLSDKFEIYEQALQKVRTRLARLPALRKEHSVLEREITSSEARRRDLQDKLAAARDLAQLESPAFSVVAEATAPKKPLRSNRRMVFAAASVGGSFLIALAIALLCLLDRTIKSPAEVELHLGAPVLAEANTSHLEVPLEGVEDDHAFLFLARRVRHELGEIGARLLVVGIADGTDGRLCAVRLARALHDADERVLMIEGRFPNGEPHPLLGSDQRGRTGFGDLVMNSSTSVSDHLVEVRPGLMVLPAGTTPVAPARYGSPRVGDLLERASAEASVVLIDVAPVEAAPDALLLAAHADAALIVLPAGRLHPRQVGQVAARLRSHGTRVLGAVLTDVDPLFSENRP